MASIVYHTDKKSGSTYAFRSESYRDPVTRKPRNRREYLGRVDPETGEIIPKKPRRQSSEPQPAIVPATPAATTSAAPATTTDATDVAADIAALEAEIAAVRAERDALAATLARLCEALETSADEVRGVLQALRDAGA